MNILHIDCSPRATGHSRQLSAALIDRVLEELPGATVTRRDLARGPIPHATAEYGCGLASPAAYTPALVNGAFDFSESLVQELERSDVVVIGTPMNNYTVPSTLKAWIDQILRMGRTMTATPNGKVGLLKDRPVLVGIASGGVFAGEGANQPDFLTPCLTLVFECIGLTSVRFFPLQATAFLDEAPLAEARRNLVKQVDDALPSLRCPA